jgi:NAD(P)-dependent dehydrogenase (short-subunit alcohol dehydrogenase family)
MRLDGRVALVTGGSRGIGLAIGRALADAGAIVVTCGRTPTHVPPPLEFVPCDIRDPDAGAAMIDELVRRHGRLDILVNNAGGSPEAPAATASPRFAERVIALNLLAPLTLSQSAYPHMRDRGGAIVNISSVSAIRPSPGTAAYAAAKAGLLALGRSLAHEWGPKIRVNAVVVGYVETENTAATYGGATTQRAIGATLAARRLGRAEEVAAAVLFLASDAASYVTGATLSVDGGGERPAFLDLVHGDR